MLVPVVGAEEHVLAELPLPEELQRIQRVLHVRKRRGRRCERRPGLQRDSRHALVVEVLDPRAVRLAVRLPVDAEAYGRVGRAGIRRPVAARVRRLPDGRRALRHPAETALALVGVELRPRRERVQAHAGEPGVLAIERVRLPLRALQAEALGWKY